MALKRLALTKVICLSSLNLRHFQHFKTYPSLTLTKNV